MTRGVKSKENQKKRDLDVDGESDIKRDIKPRSKLIKREPWYNQAC